MIKFFVRIFAAIGFVLTLVLVLGALIAYHQDKQAMDEPESALLSIDFTQDIVEQNDPSPLDLAMHEDTLPLLDIIHAIDKARMDPHVKGIIARFGEEQPNLAQAQEIRAAIARFRSSGKVTYAFAPSYGSFGLGNRAYYLASAFENVWLQPVGSVSLTGVAIDSPFAKTALDKLGVTADFMQREEYKSFMEPAQRDTFSAPVKAMMQGLVDDLSDQVATGIAENHKWDAARVKQLMEKGPFTDDEALKNELVTKVGYWDELDKEIDDKAGTDAKQVDVEDYLGYGGDGKLAKPKAHIAVIYGTGLIADKASGPADISGEHVMGADTVADAFDAAADDKDIKAILFRVDSPGGSPEASETVRRAMVHAQSKGKPVIVSMGEEAASGGYWISMNADRIVADPGTITGSIGVLSGKFVFGGLMDKLGVHVDTIRTTETAGLWSMAQGFTPAQRDRVNAMLDQTYHAFVKNVSDARKIPMEKMPDIAKGRVWTGAQAQKLGLVDDLGGYDVAVADIRKKLDLKDDDMISLEVFPAPETPVERVMKLLRGIGVESAMIRSALIEWKGMQAAIGPVWENMAAIKPVSARLPAHIRPH
ncbi:MAG TPA: signal peptide peptidase SppA [Alphaproteobacteria bacterium]|nr:signal peptide peptidase SppA [Alphaproteobacteria bacterium]